MNHSVKIRQFFLKFPIYLSANINHLKIGFSRLGMYLNGSALVLILACTRLWHWFPTLGKRWFHHYMQGQSMFLFHFALSKAHVKVIIGIFFSNMKITWLYSTKLYTALWCCSLFVYFIRTSEGLERRRLVPWKEPSFLLWVHQKPVF